MSSDKDLEKKLQNIKNEEELKHDTREIKKYENVIRFFESLFFASLTYIVFSVLGFTNENSITNIYLGFFLTIVCLGFISYGIILRKLINIIKKK